LFVGLVLFVSTSERIQAFSLAVLASVLASYRITLEAFDGKLPCSCLGILPDLTGMTPEVARWVSLAILGVLCAGSYVILCNRQTSGDGPATSPPLARENTGLPG
jgi:hypothetical protein